MLSLAEILKILKENKPFLRQNYSVTKLGIFGSFARGDQSKKSDIDILAEFEKLPYSRIAEVQHARIGTIRSRINRAKKKLRSALKDLDGDIL